MNLLKWRSFDDLFTFYFVLFFVQIIVSFKIKMNEEIIAIKISFTFIAWYISFAFIAILIFFFFVYFLKHWKLNVLWLFLQNLHRHFNVFFNKNILSIDVFARNIRSIIYFCKHTFSNCIFNISYIALFYSFFCNTSLFLCLIL